MFCTSCGAKNEDLAKFCVQCGTKLEQSPTAAIANAPAGKKNGKFKVAFILIAVLIIASSVAMAKDSIVMKVAPKAYVGNVFNKTFKKISEEIAESKKQLAGPALSKNDDFTVGLSAMIDSMSSNSSYNDFSGVKEVGISTNISVLNSKKQLFGQMNFLHKDDALLSANIFLNDEEIGVNIPELFDQYWTAQTKNFGRKWNESFYGSNMTDIELKDNLDISFSELIDSSKKGLTAESKQEIAKATKELLKNSKLDDISSTPITIGKKNVKAKQIPIVVSGSELKSYLVDLLKIYKNDENFKNGFALQNVLPGGVYDNFDEIIDNFKDYIDVRGDVTLKIIEYKGMVVKFSLEKEFEFDEEIAALNFDVSFKDNKALINEIAIYLGLEIDGEALVIEIDSKGNHIPQKGLFTDNTSIVINIPYEDKVRYDSENSINLKNSTISGNCRFKVDSDEGFSIDYSGKYSSSKGLNISLDDVSLIVNDYGDTAKIYGSIDYALTKGAKDNVISVSDKEYILDLDGDQFWDYLSRLNLYEKINQIGEKFDRAFN